MTHDDLPNRCRLVLIADPRAGGGMDAGRVLAALSGGDVASLILVAGAVDDGAFQTYCEAIVPDAQARGVAVVIAGDTRTAGRVGADGIHMETGKDEIAEAVRKHDGKLIVGAGGAKTRHDALELGEAQPDYIFFGRFNYDNTPEPHPRNVGLAEWWAEIVQVPCITLGGSTIESAETIAKTGAEFVALSAAIFANDVDPAAAVASTNALLDKVAPSFET